MTFDLGRRLLLANTIAQGELLRAVDDAVRRERPFARALADASAMVRAMLRRPIEGGERAPIEAPVVDRELLRALPRGLPARLLAAPLRRDAATGVVEIAVVDPLDRHLAAELAYHLAAPVRLLAAPLEAVEHAIAAAVREATVAASDAPADDETPVLLVRRASRPSIASVAIDDSSLRRAGGSLPPPAGPAANVVLDFSAAAREERASRYDPPPPAPAALRRPPFPSLDVVRIERAADRDTLLFAILDALLATATHAALLAPRRGQWEVVAAQGPLGPLPRAPAVPPTGALERVLASSVRAGPLDPHADAPLLHALDLRAAPRTDVLLRAVIVATKPALVLCAHGSADLEEATRRAAAIAGATSATLLRILRTRPSAG